MHRCIDTPHACVNTHAQTNMHNSPVLSMFLCTAELDSVVAFSVDPVKIVNLTIGFDFINMTWHYILDVCTYIHIPYVRYISW